MPNLNHPRQTELTDKVSEIIAAATKITNAVFNAGSQDGTFMINGKPVRLGSTTMAEMISHTTGFSKTFCQAIISNWLSEHPDLAIKRGQGIFLRHALEEIRINREIEKYETRRERQLRIQEQKLRIQMQRQAAIQSLLDAKPRSRRR